MLALALTIALIQPQEAPRLRTICKNGTVVLAEKMASDAVRRFGD